MKPKILYYTLPFVELLGYATPFFKPEPMTPQFSNRIDAAGRLCSCVRLSVLPQRTERR